MSRSFKKPYVKIGCPGMKTTAARMERRIVKQLLKPWKYCYLPTIERSCFGCECDLFGEVCDFIHNDVGPLLPLRKQIVNSYDICDIKFYRPDDKYYYRK